MHAASRAALSHGNESLDKLLWNRDQMLVVAAKTGTELFEVVETLDADRALRVALAEASYTPEQRAGIATKVFQGKIADETLKLLTDIVSQTWSTTAELREGLVQIGRRSLLRGAESQDQLELVEDEIYSLSSLLDRESKLTQLLSDRTAEPDAKRGLLANVLYGKVNMVTEALALQIIGRPEDNPIDDLRTIADQAAELRGKAVAQVISSVELNEGQQATLAEKLGHIYGREMSIHSEVDPSLLGGMIIRAFNEVIDGSTSGKLARMRTALA